MKFLPCLILLALLCLTGCITRYDITTSNGGVITTQGKPKYDKTQSCWTYVDLTGKSHTIPSGAVSQVAPQSMDISDSEQKFNPVVKK